MGYVTCGPESILNKETCGLSKTDPYKLELKGQSHQFLVSL